MKRSIIIVIGVLLCLLIVALGTVYAQSMDEERMDRDLAVASNVLKSLLTGDRGGMFWGGGDYNAEYMEGYGVVIELPRSYAYVTRGVGTAVTDKGSQIIIEDREEEEKEEERSDRERELEKADRAREAAAREMERAVLAEWSFGEQSSEELIETVKTFLVDYGNLIGQLKPSDKIVVKRQANADMIFVWSQGNENSTRNRPGQNNLSISARVSDIQAYKEGKIDRDEAIKRIEVLKEEAMKVEEDLRLFSSILRTVYESNLSKTYFMTGAPRPERLKDYGVIYHAKFFSSNPMGFGDDAVHTLPTLGLKDVPQADRDKKVEELYPEFISGLKNNMIEYGRTISSLDDNEKMTIRATLTKCVGCKIPESVELSVQAGVLKDYSSGKIDLKSAVSKISLKEVGQQ